MCWLQFTPPASPHEKENKNLNQKMGFWSSCFGFSRRTADVDMMASCEVRVGGREACRARRARGDSEEAFQQHQPAQLSLARPPLSLSLACRLLPLSFCLPGTWKRPFPASRGESGMILHFCYSNEIISSRQGPPCDQGQFRERERESFLPCRRRRALFTLLVQENTHSHAFPPPLFPISIISTLLRTRTPSRAPCSHGRSLEERSPPRSRSRRGPSLPPLPLPSPPPL